MKREYYRLSKFILITLGLIIFISVQTSAQNVSDAKNAHLTVDGKKVLVTNDPSDVALSVKDAEALHKEPVTINTDTGHVTTESGQTVSMQDVFDISGTEERKLFSEDSLENKQKITDHLENEGLYQIDDSEKDELTVSFPYVYKRILVFVSEGTLKDSYGAYQVSYYTLSGDYVLDYPSEEAAMEAYEKLIMDFGREKVLRDIPMHICGQTFTETSATSSSWGSDMMHLDEVRDYINSNATITNTVTVAVLDTGINKDHELFTGRLADGETSFIADEIGIADGKGHGTHVAGIIADGTPKLVKILPIKVLNSNGRGSVSSFIHGIDYAIEKKVKVINISMAADFKGDEENGNRIQEALKKAYSYGILCVSAAGNDLINMDSDESIVYPAESEYVFAVSAIDKNKKIWTSSNYGSNIIFTAPGVGITSASKDGNNQFTIMTGTSMAAPHVSAACAILSLYNPDISYNNMLNKLEGLTEDLGDKGKDNYYGSGLIVFNSGDIPGFVHKPVPVSKSSSGSTESTAKATTAATTASTANTSSTAAATTTAVKTNTQPLVKKGNSYRSAGQTYKVTKTATAKATGTVSFTKAKNAKSIKVPATIQLSDKKTYKVTAINAKAFTAKKIRTVTIGSKVSKMNKNAFASSKAAKIILNTRLLKKASVKGSLNDSKVRTIQVKVGSKAMNKKYIKNYKKIFTKNNAGAKVTVK